MVYRFRISYARSKRSTTSTSTYARTTICNTNLVIGITIQIKAMDYLWIQSRHICRLDESTSLWVVVSALDVVEAGFRVEVVALPTEWVDVANGRIAKVVHFAIAKAVVLVASTDFCALSDCNNVAKGIPYHIVVLAVVANATQSINVVEVANGVRSTVFAHDSVAVQEILCCNTIYNFLESCSVLIILVQNVAVNTCKQISTNVREICGHSVGCAANTVAKFVVPNCPFFHTRGDEMGKERGKPFDLPLWIIRRACLLFALLCID